jgi:hypothetical protein
MVSVARTWHEIDDWLAEHHDVVNSIGGPNLPYQLPVRYIRGSPLLYYYSQQFHNLQIRVSYSCLSGSDSLSCVIDFYVTRKLFSRHAQLIRNWS